jgi:hypothetical protein
MEWLKVLGPEFKPQYWKKKKKRENFSIKRSLFFGESTRVST